jgi:hypothetical protein
MYFRIMQTSSKRVAIWSHEREQPEKEFPATPWIQLRPVGHRPNSSRTTILSDTYDLNTVPNTPRVATMGALPAIIYVLGRNERKSHRYGHKIAYIKPASSLKYVPNIN